MERYPWTPKYNAVPTDWPAKGLRMEMTFAPTGNMVNVKDVKVKVNYEIYQGLPVIAKWIEVINDGVKSVVLDELESEVLAVNQDQKNRIHVESDFSFALVNADLQGSALMHSPAHRNLTMWDRQQPNGVWTANTTPGHRTIRPKTNSLAFHITICLLAPCLWAPV